MLDVAQVLKACGLQHHVAPDRVTVKEFQKAVLGQRLRSMWRRLGNVDREIAEQRSPFAIGSPDNLVGRTFPADVVMRRDRGEFRDTNGFTEGLCLSGAVILVSDHARNTDIAAEFSEVLDRGADVVGNVE